MANANNQTIENHSKNNHLANRFSVAQTKKNAAADDPHNDVNKHAKRDTSPYKHTPKRGRSAISLYGKATHKQVAKCIGYALVLGTSKAWEGLSLILVARLTKEERAALAYSALTSLDDETAYLTASVALFGVLKGEVLK